MGLAPKRHQSPIQPRQQSLAGKSKWNASLESDGLRLSNADWSEVIFPTTALLDQFRNNQYLRLRFVHAVEMLISPLKENEFEQTKRVVLSLFNKVIGTTLLRVDRENHDFALMVGKISHRYWRYADLIGTYINLHPNYSEIYNGILEADKLFSDWMAVILDQENHFTEKPRYSTDKKAGESAMDFLYRVYGRRLITHHLTLSQLRTIDRDLWMGLRNWAHHKKVKLDYYIPRGEAKRGRKPLEGTPEEITVHKQQLAAERARRYRQRKSHLAPK